MIKNLSIKNKLLFIILIPFLVLIYFSVLNFIIIKKDIDNLNNFEKCLTFTNKMNKLIYSLQRERGFI